jgi:hypothetical protein
MTGSGIHDAGVNMNAFRFRKLLVIISFLLATTFSAFISYGIARAQPFCNLDSNHDCCSPGTAIDTCTITGPFLSFCSGGAIMPTGTCPY